MGVGFPRPCRRRIFPSVAANQAVPEPPLAFVDIEAVQFVRP